MAIRPQIARPDCVVPQRASIIFMLHPNAFSNARRPIAIRNRCRTLAIPLHIDQNPSSNTQPYKNLATRPNIFMRSLVNTIATQVGRAVLRRSPRVKRAGRRACRVTFFRHRIAGSLHQWGSVLGVLAGSTSVL